MSAFEGKADISAKQYGRAAGRDYVLDAVRATGFIMRRCRIANSSMIQSSGVHAQMECAQSPRALNTATQRQYGTGLPTTTNASPNSRSNVVVGRATTSYRVQTEEPMPETILQSTITCPNCASSKTETMPTDACQFFYNCAHCGVRLKPKAGDCCVFCSYGDVPCPRVQEAGENDVQAVGRPAALASSTSLSCPIATSYTKP